MSGRKTCFAYYVRRKHPNVGLRVARLQGTAVVISGRRCGGRRSRGFGVQSPRRNPKLETPGMRGLSLSIWDEMLTGGGGGSPCGPSSKHSTARADPAHLHTAELQLHVFGVSETRSLCNGSNRETADAS